MIEVKAESVSLEELDRMINEEVKQHIRREARPLDTERLYHQVAFLLSSCEPHIGLYLINCFRSMYRGNVDVNLKEWSQLDNENRGLVLDIIQARDNNIWRDNDLFECEQRLADMAEAYHALRAGNCDED